jgi:hypothetical protein
MPATHEFGLHLTQFRPHPFPHRVSDEQELSAPRRTADMREPQDRLPKPTIPAVSSRVATELNEASLVPMQFEPELCESLAELALKALGLGPMLKPNHDVVSEAHDDDVTASLLLPPAVGP